MTTLQVGIASLDQFRDYTLAVARGAHKPGPDEPKIWFTSIESFAKVLSDKNRDLLKLIARTQPASMEDLAAASGRAPSNLSRTLKTMERYGLVRFETGRGRKRAPRVPYTDIVLGMSLQSAREPA